MRIGKASVGTASEPVVGWKIWRVEHGKERTRLRSVLYGSLWPPGRPAVADCKKLYRVRHEARSAVRLRDPRREVARAVEPLPRRRRRPGLRPRAALGRPRRR